MFYPKVGKLKIKIINFNFEKQLCVRYFLSARLQLTQINLMVCPRGNMPRIIVRVKNMVCPNLSRKQTLFGLATY